MTKRYYMALALPLIAVIAAIGAVTRPSAKRELNQWALDGDWTL
jgi:hypothetical protein